MIRRLGLVGALALVALLLAGCQAKLNVDVSLDRDGRGSVTLRLTMDAAAQEALGLSPTAIPTWRPIASRPCSQTGAGAAATARSRRRATRAPAR